MLYVGSFEFYYDYDDDESRCGSFIYLREAESPEAAIDLFKKGLKKMRAKSATFQRISKIYLDSFIEISKLPQEGEVAFYREQGYDPKSHDFSINCALPSHSKGIIGFNWYPDRKEPKDDEGEHETGPFLVFRTTRKEHKKKMDGHDALHDSKEGRKMTYDELKLALSEIQNKIDDIMQQYDEESDD